MNFFEHQDRARRNSFRLIVLFCVAVILIIAGISIVVMAVLNMLGFFTDAQDARRIAAMDDPQAFGLVFWHPVVFAYTAGATLLVIIGGSLYKIAELAQGGSAVARMLGGQTVNPGTTDPDERKLRNVVEEMAIASGVPVPGIYLLADEQGINAFAAGFSTRDAVVGVTRGCIEQLTRDELQGVIAHEFSHIFNGDMRLNIRLIGLLHGILVIGMIGYGLLRSTFYARPRYGYSRRGGRNEGGAVVAMLSLGLVLIILGYIGVFFGRLIQAAVSRQREFLADASAVQFTRNPGGIAGALKKIGGLSHGARVSNAHAMEASHLFFGNAVGSAFSSWMATHPPLVQRIRAIDPTFDGTFPKITPPPRQRPTAMAAEFAGTASGAVPPPLPRAGDARQRMSLDPGRVTEHVGTVSPEHVRLASELLGSIPSSIAAAAREPFGARAVVYCLLLDEDREVRLKQIDHLRQSADPQVYHETLKLIEPVMNLGAGARLPLLDIAVPALRELSPQQMDRFRQNLRALIEADAQVSLFEYALYKILQHHLPDEKRPGRPVVQYYSLKPMLGDAAVILSALARAGETSADEAQAAFAAGMRRLGVDQPLQPPADLNWQAIDRALDRLSISSPPIKHRIIDAAAHTAAADGTIHLEQAELLRALSAVLDCPLPPFLQSQRR